jgi:hypothetical protein
MQVLSPEPMELEQILCGLFPNLVALVPRLVQTFERLRTREIGTGTVRVFRQEFTPEDAIGAHACSLEPLACVWPMPFLSGVH